MNVNCMATAMTSWTVNAKIQLGVMSVLVNRATTPSLFTSVKVSWFLIPIAHVFLSFRFIPELNLLSMADGEVLPV